jgi:hypothetical protein
MVDDWQRRGVLSDVRDRTRLLFRVEPDVVLSTAPQVQAAQYPLSVRLTRLIMTPGWLQKCDQRTSRLESCCLADSRADHQWLPADHSQP